MDDGHDETSAVTRLREAENALRSAGREVKWWQTEYEHSAEALQRVRRQRARLRQQGAELADALASELSASYWREQESGQGRLRRRTPDARAALVREVESSAHFDAGWYLRQHQRAIIEQRVAPALHHVLHANERKLDPSEGFSTGRYLIHHPDVASSGLPALLHAERHGLLHDGVVDVEVEATDS